MRKIDADNRIWLDAIPMFDPRLMRTSDFLMEAKAVFFQEISDVVIAPVA
jgi:hypothetical protein